MTYQESLNFLDGHASSLNQKTQQKLMEATATLQDLIDKQKKLKYYKAEYERLRRSKNKEIKHLRRQYHNFIIATWNLLRLFMKEKEIIKYYDDIQHL